MKISFNLDCEPPRVTKQMKKTIFRRGKVLHIDTPELKEAQALYMGLLLTHRPAKPLEGPLRLCICWTFPHLASAKKTNLVYKDTAPDLDNMEKVLVDLLAKMEFLANDGQVADKRTVKLWGRTPGILIQIEEIDRNAFIQF